MKIGEIAKRSGFSKDTLRYYEKIGLIQLSKKQRGDNNYRIYDESKLQQLLLIRQLKNAGFTLNEIKDLLRMEELNMISCSRVSGMVTIKLEQIEQEIAALQQKKSQLLSLMKSCEGDCIESIRK